MTNGWKDHRGGEDSPVRKIDNPPSQPTRDAPKPAPPKPTPPAPPKKKD